MRIARNFSIVAVSLLSFAAVDDRLARHRNLGKAFYENPATQVQAVDEFRKALELAPNSARERLNYGLALLRAGKSPEGIAEIEKVQKQDPKIPHTWFNLGIQYKKQGDAARAITQFERMVKLAPEDAVAQYNLGASYKLAGRQPEALKYFEAASKLDPNLAGPHFQLFNAYRIAGRQADAARELETFQRIKKQQEGAAIPEDMEWNMFAEIYDVVEPSPALGPAPKYVTRKLAGAVDAATSGMALIDAEADGKPDLLVWSSKSLVLYRNGSTAVIDAFPAGPVVFAAVGDFNNDGLTDVAALTPTGVILYRNAKGKFVKHEASLPAGVFNAAVWLDYDHDYDLDLFLLGKQSKLVRNQGTAGFADRSSDFPFAPGEAIAGVAYRLIADTKGMDLAVSYRDRKSVLYRDKLAGVFDATALDAIAMGTTRLQADDANHDGQIEVSAASGLPAISADFDVDGDIDVVRVASDGSLERMDNQTGGVWLSVRLHGVKNLKLARHAEVEVKAGGLYAKKIYEEVPLVFDLGSYKEADAVRITWPNGLIQNETKQAAGKAYAYKEAQRLSGSCPMIWTWNGREFVFVTDVLGVAPLGASSGDGKYFPVDHDEYIQIPRGMLVERDGSYEVRITEELSEVAYLDKIALIAVDHPANVEVFTNDKFKAPPFPEFRLFGVKRRIAPVGARQQGVDVLSTVLRRDRIYPEHFRRDLSGVAETWAIDLDFGRDAARGNHAVMVLNGWVDWADGSTFLSKAQEGGGLIAPYLQVKNTRGEWQTVIEDMGMPAGKPKTIAVDLSGKFLSASREVRVVTNLAVYWDEIFLSEETAAPDARLTRLAPVADLRFRGFSHATIHPQRRQPESFAYPDPSPVSMWNQTPGMYTRYGAVDELLARGDDRFVIMGSGDELRLRFDATRLPPLALGRTRDFLLLVEGWAKDRDANTAFSQTVEPLPFRAMSAYPYPSGERYPDGTGNRAWRERYNLRPALRPLRPLRPEGSSR